MHTAKLAGLTHVPVYIRTANDTQLLELALVENIQRENLNPIEISLSYQRLLTECNLKQDALGQRVGKNRTTVNNYLRLLKLPPEIQIALRDQKISMGHIRALINVPDACVQVAMLQRIINEDLSVRTVETLARTQLQPKTGHPSKPPALPTPLAHTLRQFSTQLANRLGTPVHIHTNAHQKGTIKIAFNSPEALQKIINLLNV